MAAWTEERRKRQRELIAKVSPWRHSTGPRSVEGKARSARNSQKHGRYSMAEKTAYRRAQRRIKALWLLASILDDHPRVRFKTSGYKMTPEEAIAVACGVDE